MNEQDASPRPIATPKASTTDTARRHLTEEHGVEPGTELRAVHAALLADVPVAPLAPAAPPASAVPGVSAAPASAPLAEGTTGTEAAPPQGGSVGMGRSRRSGRWRVAGAVAAALVPLVTVGLATWALIAFFAARRRSGRLAAAGAYFVLVAFPLVVIDPAAGGGPLIAPAVLAWLVPVLGGAAHAAVLALDRPAQAASSTSPPGATSAANVA